MSLLGYCFSKLVLCLSPLALLTSLVPSLFPLGFLRRLWPASRRRSCIWASVSIKGLQRQGASFMSTSLSFNNQTMMDYRHTDIHLKATSKAWKTGEEKENTSMLFDSSRTVCWSVRVSVRESVFVCLYWMLLWLSFSKKDRQVPPSRPPSIPSSYHGLLGSGRQLLLSFLSDLSGQAWQV